nr:MAG TPA: hypothetical protein [Caudoviricetes sp.]
MLELNCSDSIQHISVVASPPPLNIPSIQNR